MKLLFGLLFICGICAGFSPENFRYEMTVNYPEKSAKTAVILKLPQSVFARCSHGITDMRFYDGEYEVPYKIIASRSQKESESWKKLAITGFEMDDVLEKSVITLENKDKYQIDEIEMLTHSVNFSCLVSVSGSDDLENWNTAGENLGIFDFSSKINFRSANIQFSPLDTRYIRLEITKNNKHYFIKEDASLLIIGNVTIWQTPVFSEIHFDGFRGLSRTQERKAEYDHYELNPSFAVNKDKNSEYILEGVNIPADRITFDSSSPVYMRNIRVYGRNGHTKDAQWNFAGSGTILSAVMDIKARDYIDLDGQFYKDLKIVIENADNPPLLVEKLTLSWRSRYAVLFTEKSSLTLLCGNESAKKPAYDLQGLLPDLIDKITGVTAFIDESVRIKTPAKPKPDMGKHLLYTGVGLFSIVLIAWIVVLLRKMEHSQENKKSTEQNNNS